MTHDQIASEDVPGLALPDADRTQWRNACRNLILQNALHKRSAGVPTYSVPEAAALLSISQEYLYRLIQADGFPAVRMRAGQGQGRYVIPARAVEFLLDTAATTGACVESAELTARWHAGASGGAA